MNVFTAWQGDMPAYIKLCMKTWRVPFTVLTYDNVQRFTDLDIQSAARFTLPQAADCIRAHVLRDQGGWWLDADTIMLAQELPLCRLAGDQITRSHSIGLLYTEPRADMYIRWAAYQDRIIESGKTPKHWAALGNQFTDQYIKSYTDIQIAPIDDFMPERYMGDGANRRAQYCDFYFDKKYKLSDIQADVLMLHNSWTPQWYKDLTEREVLACDCTLSNILRELLCNI